MVWRGGLEEEDEMVLLADSGTGSSAVNSEFVGVLDLRLRLLKR